MTVLSAQIDALRSIQPIEMAGTVAAVRGPSVLVNGLSVPIGTVVRFCGVSGRTDRFGQRDTTADLLRGEVVGFEQGHSVVMLLSQVSGIAPGMRVVDEQAAHTVRVSSQMLGRVLNGFGQPIDGGAPLVDVSVRPLYPQTVDALARARIREPLPTGVRSIDGFLTLGKGQRIGIFAGAGVGKSTLLGTIARNADADVNVIAMIGERGREVREFIEESLGDDGLRRSVVIVATGDESPLLRVRAAHVACAIAEYFRESNADVMLMMDSVTRFAQAQRQIGLAIGEQPATRGYPPSVFAQLPVLLERAGAIEGSGSVTGVYAVLVEGDDLDEPISDAARGVLDGHIVLSRQLVTRGHFPAVDVLESISRVASDVCDETHRRSRSALLRLLAAYRESEELINIGAYAAGSNADTDVAIAMRAELAAFLQQGTDEPASYPQTCRRLIELTGIAEQQAMRLASQQRQQVRQEQAQRQQSST